MDEESYSNNLNKILQTARGPISEIENFETPNNLELSNIIVKKDAISDESELRSKIRKLAAVMAVISISVEDSNLKSTIGRQLGSAWAQDHRLTAMGLPGIANHRAKRSTWR
tara:strand:+ start:194 stop:529 length:336 start_codon:yes stop_codon:yes gene_type:complete